MKKTIQQHLTVAAIALIIVIALSATAFADSRQMSSPSQGGMQMDQQMGGPQGGFGQNGPQDGFGRDQQMGGPQGGFGQNNGQQPPEMPEGNEPPAGGQEPPEKPEGDENRTPPADGENSFGRNDQMRRDGRDPMNWIFSAVNELEDEEVRANLESLMQAHRDAMDAERNAEDDDARAKAAEAVFAARNALNDALTAAGIEVSTEAPDGQPPEMPEGNEPPADGQQPPEKPEGDEDRTPPSDGQLPPEKPEGDALADGQQLSEDDQNLFPLFRQFLEWLKGNNEA